MDYKYYFMQMDHTIYHDLQNILKLYNRSWAPFHISAYGSKPIFNQPAVYCHEKLTRLGV